jgi:hypothetical protein
VYSRVSVARGRSGICIKSPEVRGDAFRIVVAAALAALLALGVSACGDEDDSTTATSPASTRPAPDEGDRKAAGKAGAAGKATSESEEGDDPAEGKPGGSPHQSAAAYLEEAEMDAQQDSGGGSQPFRVPGGDNSIQEYGSEASDSEREEAAIALHAFLAAQANRDWATVCTYLSQKMHEQLEQLAASSGTEKETSCTATLTSLLAGASSGTPEEVRQADVGSLRVEGDSGFILYRGARDTNFTISVVEEDGEWKMGALAPSSIYTAD